MVMPNRIYELRTLYFQQHKNDSYHQAGPEYQPPGWLNYSLPEQHHREGDLLRKILSPDPERMDSSIAEKIFGTHLRRNYVDLQHNLNLLRERSMMHERHIKEIDDRHRKTQERLFGTEINYFPDRDRQIRQWESQLSQLEQQKREAETSFWKDTVELRKELFQAAGDYHSTQHRYRTLAGLGENYGIY